MSSNIDLSKEDLAVIASKIYSRTQQVSKLQPQQADASNESKNDSKLKELDDFYKIHGVKLEKLRQRNTTSNTSPSKTATTQTSQNTNWLYWKSVMQNREMDKQFIDQMEKYSQKK